MVTVNAVLGISDVRLRIVLKLGLYVLFNCDPKRSI